jgi:hypothetical protein
MHADIDMYGAQLTGREGEKRKHPEILSFNHLVEQQKQSGPTVPSLFDDRK